MESRRPATGCLRWLKRIVLGILLLVLLFLIGGAIYQEYAARQDAAAFSPLGKMIDIGGFRLHLYCKGTGSPSVIFEAGAGQYSLYWLEIQDRIAETHQACVYDRAGLGWSDFSNTVPSSEVVATNLHLLLNNAGISAPYLFVGHSSG